MGGNHVIAMSTLRACFEGIGCEDVRTVLQSGNVLFTSTARSTEALRGKIEAALTKAFDYPAKVYVYPVGTLDQAIREYPFDRSQAAFHHYVVFVNGNAVDAILKDAAGLDQKFEAVEGNALFIYWRVQKGKSAKSAFAKVLARAKYRNQTTVRNMNTLKKMVVK